MGKPVSFDEVITYLAYRQMGLSGHEAARRTGRSPSTMSKFDQALKLSIVATDLEQIFLEASEMAAAKVLPPAVSASGLFLHNPDLTAKVRALAKGVKRAADRLGVQLRTPGQTQVLDGTGDVSSSGIGVQGG